MIFTTILSYPQLQNPACIRERRPVPHLRQKLPRPSSPHRHHSKAPWPVRAPPPPCPPGPPQGWTARSWTSPARLPSAARTRRHRRRQIRRRHRSPLPVPESTPHRRQQRRWRWRQRPQQQLSPCLSLSGSVSAGRGTVGGANAGRTRTRTDTGIAGGGKRWQGKVSSERSGPVNRRKVLSKWQCSCGEPASVRCFGIA